MTDPHWPRAEAWLAGDQPGASEHSIGLVGAPLHVASISPSRADLAPAAIRAALSRFSTWDAESDGDLRNVGISDAGDLDIAQASPEDALEPVSQAVAGLRDAVDVVVILGGDNSVTRPGVHGTAPLESCGVLTFDAHFDLRETDAGLTNGNPIRALLEDGLPGPHITQIGLQSFANSPAHARVAREAGIQVVTREEVATAGIQAMVVRELTRLASQTEVIYVDFDIDVLDRVFAPATPGARPGGLAPTELFQAAALCGAHPSVVAADIVEISPPADTNEVTVFSAAKVLLSLAAGLGTRRS